MKGIPMKDWEVRAILADRKTVTRRVVKPPALYAIQEDESGKCVGSYYEDEHTAYTYPTVDDCQYSPGDILYVQETWAVWSPTYGTTPEIIYKADGYSQSHKMKWRPSVHMPREAARIFLRVTNVRVERLRDISLYDVWDEGTPQMPGNTATDDAVGHDDFAYLWDSTLKPADRALYGWAANPWVWVIEFERCEKPKGGVS